MQADVRSLNFLPQFFPADWLKGAPDIVHSDFPSRIRIGYVLRDGGRYSYLMRPDFEALEVSLQQLHESAVSNLAALPLPNLSIGKTPGGPEAFLSDDVDNFTAVRILMPRVRGAITAELGAEYYLAIPCRDWLFCWSTVQAKERQAHNASEAKRIYQTDDYSLTPDILRVSGSGFAIYQEQAVDV